MKGIALLLAITLIFSLVGCTAATVKEPDVTEPTDKVTDAPSSDTTEDTTEAIPLIDDKIEIKDDIFTDEKAFSEGVSAEIYITAPEISAPYYGESVDLLNELIETNIDSFKNDYLQDVAVNEGNEGAVSSSRMLVYKPYYAENGKVSVLLSCNIYIGGSDHPSIVHRGINFDLESGSAITISDIIGCDIDTVKSKIIEKMREDPDMYYSTEDNALEAFDITNTFLFDDEKVYIFFDEYQIGPRAAGFTIFEFTYDELA